MRTVLFAVLSLLVLAPQAADAARRDDRTTQASRPQASRAQAVTRPATRGVPQRDNATPPRAAALAQSGQPTARAVRSGQSVRPGEARSTRPGQSTRSGQVAVRRDDVRAQRRGTVVRGAAAATISRDFGNCTRRNGRAICGGDRSLGWQAGLPAMTMEQRDCPAGTFATLARGHDDVIRCMPL
jgi:hypothetical protein